MAREKLRHFHGLIFGAFALPFACAGSATTPLRCFSVPLKELLAAEILAPCSSASRLHLVRGYLARTGQ
jgi:hypothetical protein